jgi:oxygen-independent coproporphyrinogen-3 oxidase
MTRFQTSWSAPELQVPFLDSVADRLRELQNDDLVRLTETSCEVTDEGRPFLRNICMAFDAHLARQEGAQKLFSQTI